jgi:thiamine pyrophosphate-dependent acetolactate synthase large subunit-like protein
MHDTSAVLLLAGAGSTHFYGRAGMQEIYYRGHEDAVNILRPITKGVWICHRPDTVIDTLNQAYKLAVTGRPGPVFVQLPYDVQLAEIEGEIEGPAARAVSSRMRADTESVARAAELVRAAEHPVILAGGGVRLSGGAPAALQALVERHDLPFVTTLTAKGVVSEDHPNSVMVVGRSGTLAASGGRVFIDVGDVIQYAEAYMTVRGHGVWNINPGMAEMSWASSGVLGAVAADRSRPAIALTGDGAFNMVSNSLATAVEYDLPAIWVILNNHELGIERKGANAAYQRVHPWVQFVRRDTGEPYNPDYVKLADANGAMGEVVERAADFTPALERALASRRPYVIDVRTDLSVPSYFTKGIDRAYPGKWGESYPGYGSLRIAR